MKSNLKDMNSFLTQTIKDSADLQYVHRFTSDQLDVIFSNPKVFSMAIKNDKLLLRRSTNDTIYSCEIDIDFLPISNSKWKDLELYFNAIDSRDKDDIDYYETLVTDEEIDTYLKFDRDFEKYVYSQINDSMSKSKFFTTHVIDDVEVLIKTYL